MNDEGLKQAARNYLRALEDDTKYHSCPSLSMLVAREQLAEAAMLWAQGEAIEQVEASHSKTKRTGNIRRSPKKRRYHDRRNK